MSPPDAPKPALNDTDPPVTPAPADIVLDPPTESLLDPSSTKKSPASPLADAPVVN